MNHQGKHQSTKRVYLINQSMVGMLTLIVIVHIIDISIKQDHHHYQHIHYHQMIRRKKVKLLNIWQKKIKNLINTHHHWYHQYHQIIGRRKIDGYLLLIMTILYHHYHCNLYHHQIIGILVINKNYISLFMRDCNTNFDQNESTLSALLSLSSSSEKEDYPLSVVSSSASAPSSLMTSSTLLND